MADYSEEIATALELISEFGETFQLRAPASSIPEANKRWRVTDIDPVDTPMQAIVFPEGMGDKMYIAASGLEVVPVDGMLSVQPNGQLWAFVNGSIKTLDPAGDGQVILYIADVVRWPI